MRIFRFCGFERVVNSFDDLSEHEQQLLVTENLGIIGFKSAEQVTETLELSADYTPKVLSVLNTLVSQGKVELDFSQGYRAA